MDKLIAAVITVAIVMSLLIMSVFTWAVVKPALIDGKVIGALRTVVTENRKEINSLKSDNEIFKRALIPATPQSAQ